MERGHARAVVGVDVGTTSTKAGVYDLAGRELASAGVPTMLRRGPGNAVEQDPAELLASALSAVGAAVTNAGIPAESVIGLAVSGQMAGVMGIDGAGEAVTPYDSWLDARCTTQLHALAADNGDLVLRITGCPPMINHAPKMQWWRDERPGEYDRIARFVQPAVYVAGRLAGLEAEGAFIDPTYLHFTGLADAQQGAWSPVLTNILDLDADKLPRIVASDAIVGYLTAQAAEACGLPAGIPLAAGMGDTAAGALGSGLTREGELLDTAGTAAVLTGCVSEYRADPDGGLMVMRGGLRGQWMALNYVAGGGLCLPWLAAQTTSTPIAPGHPGTDPTTVDESTLADLFAEAQAAPPGAGGALFVPHLEGRVAPYQPSMRGGFAGLRVTHGRGHLARAVLEGIAFEYAGYAESMRQTHPGTNFDAMRSIGGGARSALWNQIKADVLGVPVRRVEIHETATRGAALLAAGAAGEIDIDAVATDVPMGAPQLPDADRHELYRERLTAYRQLVDAYAALVPTRAPAGDPGLPTPTPPPTGLPATSPERPLLA
jgi:xylulokinase